MGREKARGKTKKGLGDKCSESEIWAARGNVGGIISKTR